MVLILDNYDSFTYNLFQIFLKLGYQIKVVRSDKITIGEIEKLNPQYIVLSPGPGTPNDAGVCIEVVQKLQGKYPILGVCLGHQTILASYGVPIVNADRIVHGKVEKMIHNGKGVFRNIPQPTYATRYHSLVGKEKDIPDCFEITCRSEDGEVMGIEHKDYCLVGVQFHPESIGTKDGEKIITNFLHYRRESVPVKSFLQKVLTGKDLTKDEAFDFMDELTEGNLHDSQIGSLLTSMQIKGVTSEELAGFASLLKKKASYFPAPEPNEKRLDTCGTGGSKNSKTFNVSSIVALVVAAAEVNVVKHGNKAVTSKSGSADLYQQLGINIDMSPETCYKVYKKTGMTFLYARKFHSAMKYAGPTRAALGFRTAFNLIGPLSNPANATHQIIGVFDKAYTRIMAEALSLLNIKRAMVVHGLDGLDEISLCAPTQITELNDGWIKSYIFNPEEIGLKFVDHEFLVGGDVAENMAIAYDILNGIASPKMDLVLLNAGAALYLYDKVPSIKEGYTLAKEIINSKKPLSLLQEVIKLSNES